MVAMVRPWETATRKLAVAKMKTLSTQTEKQEDFQKTELKEVSYRVPQQWLSLMYGFPMMEKWEMNHTQVYWGQTKSPWLSWRGEAYVRPKDIVLPRIWSTNAGTLTHFSFGVDLSSSLRVYCNQRKFLALVLGAQDSSVWVQLVLNKC